MANKTPVHVEPRKNGWAVVREGNERATSVHQTQAIFSGSAPFKSSWHSVDAGGAGSCGRS